VLIGQNFEYFTKAAVRGLTSSASSMIDHVISMEYVSVVYILTRVAFACGSRVCAGSPPGYT
jgi:hypothetical protein